LIYGTIILKFIRSDFLKSNINIEKSSQEVIDVMENDSVKFEILERKELKGSDSIDSASQLFFIQNANIKLKTARIVH